jgi:hypothetical protein
VTHRIEATIALLLAGLVPAGGSALADEPRPPASPAAIVEYRDSGEWDRDLAAVTGRARRFLAAAHAGRPAVVLDVDDTSLSSYACLEERDFRRSPACARSGDLSAIPETLALYEDARRRGITVFFITGRRERLRRVTAENLRDAGFRGPLHLVLRPNRERPGTHDGFKRRERARIERRGFQILANVGDQHSDLRGGHSRRRYKLPNPMYLIRSA